MSAQDAEDNRRQCWVCFASDEDDCTALWVRPCNCKGTTKWVHQACLQRWIDEKQRGNAMAPVKCPQCNTQYAILFPHMGSLVSVLDLIDEFVGRSCPFVAAGVVVGSIYWSAVTFGAVTVMQVCGQREGMLAMESADPVFLLVALPTIPVALVLGKMVRWEDMALRALRQCAGRLPLLKRWQPTALTSAAAASEPYLNRLPLTDPVSATRVLCGALLFPSVATLSGRLLFDSVPCRVQRSLLGGVAFICAKGGLRIYHKYTQLVRLNLRRVLNFDDERSVALRERSPPPLPDADAGAI